MSKGFVLSTNVPDLMFALDFMCMWFGEDKRLSEISDNELQKVYNMLFVKN